MGDWNRYLNGEEPGTQRGSYDPWGQAAPPPCATRSYLDPAFAAQVEARLAEERAERAAREAARAAKAAEEAARKAAEKAADDLIVAQCVTVKAIPQGGKRYTLGDPVFRGCKLHRDLSTSRYGNRRKEWLVLPIEADWSVSWENLHDKVAYSRFVMSAQGLKEEYYKERYYSEYPPPVRGEPASAGAVASFLSHFGGKKNRK